MSRQRSTSMPASRFTLSAVQCVSVRNVDHVSLDGPVDCYFTMQLRPCQTESMSASAECDCLSYISPVLLKTLVANLYICSSGLHFPSPPLLSLRAPSQCVLHVCVDVLMYALCCCVPAARTRCGNRCHLCFPTARTYFGHRVRLPVAHLLCWLFAALFV
jgi:hypothetical protein